MSDLDELEKKAKANDMFDDLLALESRAKFSHRDVHTAWMVDAVLGLVAELRRLRKVVAAAALGSTPEEMERPSPLLQDLTWREVGPDEKPRATFTVTVGLPAGRKPEKP